MAGPANSLKELVKFENTLLFAGELYTTTAKLLNYCFGVRPLHEVFACAVSDPSQAGECAERAKRILDHVGEKLRLKMHEYTQANGLCSASFSDLCEQLRLFHAVYESRAVDLLFSPDDMIDMDNVMQNIEHMIAGDKKRFAARLPAALMQHVQRASSPTPTEGSSVMEYAREDGVVTSLSILRSRGEAPLVDDTLEFVQSCCRASEKVRSHDAHSLAVLQRALGEVPDKAEPMEELEQALDSLSMAWMEAMEDPDHRVGETYMKLMEQVYCRVAVSSRGAAMMRIYAPYVEQGLMPDTRHKFIPDFDQQLSMLINQLGDHQSTATDPEKFKRVSQKLLWFLLVVPRPTLFRLLMQSLDNKLIVPTVVKVLRCCRPLLSVEIPLEERKPHGETEPILINAFRTILEQEEWRWHKADQQDNLIYVIASLTRQKRAVQKREGEKISECLGEVLEESLLCVSALFALLILPHLMAGEQQAMMLKLIARLMAVHGAKDSPVRWTRQLGVDCDERVLVRAPELLCLCVDLLSRGDANSELCRTLLRLLGEKLQHDGVVLECQSAAAVLDRLNSLPWFAKYAVSGWCAHALGLGGEGAVHRQIPTGLFKSLSLDAQEKFEQVVTSFDCSPAECFLRGILELALFDKQTALEFLEQDISVWPGADDVYTKLAVALVDAMDGGAVYTPERVSECSEVLVRLLEALDPSTQWGQLANVNQSIYHGTRLVQHLLLLSSAVKIAFAKAEDADDASRHKALSVAWVLAQSWCEQCKAHVEREVQEMRRETREDRDKGVSPRGCRVEERVCTQVWMLFTEAVAISNIAPMPLSALQVLLTCLADHAMDVMRVKQRPVLDGLASDYVPNKTVYAFASPKTEQQQPSVAIVAPAQQQQQHTPVAPPTQSPPTSEHTAENPMFNGGGGSGGFRGGFGLSKRTSGFNQTPRDRRDSHGSHSSYGGGGGGYGRGRGGGGGGGFRGGPKQAYGSGWANDAQRDPQAGYRRDREEHAAAEGGEWKPHREEKNHSHNQHQQNQSQNQNQQGGFHHNQGGFGGNSTGSRDGFMNHAAQIGHEKMRENVERRFEQATVEQPQGFRGGGGGGFRGGASNGGGGEGGFQSSASEAGSYRSSRGRGGRRNKKK